MLARNRQPVAPNDGKDGPFLIEQFDEMSGWNDDTVWRPLHDGRRLNSVPCRDPSEYLCHDDPLFVVDR
jgi:hypothetical protein